MASLDWKKDVKGTLPKSWKVSSVENGPELELDNGDLLVFYEDREGKKIARYRPVDRDWATQCEFTSSGTGATVTGTHKSGGPVSIPFVSGATLKHSGTVYLPHGRLSRQELTTHQGTWHGDGGGG